MNCLSSIGLTEVVANCDHLANLRFSKTLPFAFTEHGAIQAANVLASPQAIQMGVYVVRSFIRLREMFVADTLLAARLSELEAQLAAMAQRQDDHEGRTAQQFQQIFDTLRSLMAPPPPQGRKRPIGFVVQDK
ncbi:ORF6N domain-containing protein [Duganella sp. FT80W]|uniref:ORF6N domain-containing protein n=1 Tax=Duganella guangzhouensis TaxID=2666084 RepID=A0A6I2L749_9BURK|nr:ORF6N domain-containing protein [Duganella guangzhouensis]